jgi:putative transposase
MKNKPDKQTKLTRLVDFPYKGCYRYFITLRCHKQAGHFANGNFVSEAVRALEKTAKQEGFYVWAYCFMPNHFHLLAEGKTENANLRKLISVFKQRTAFRLNRRYGARLWQPSYYDRVLRKDEATPVIARYIFENPVRKGIATDYLQYPYSGSFEFSDISQLFA